MPKKENSELELMCGLFRNEAKSGSVYYSGKHQTTGEEYVMFKNTYYEEGDNKPYFRLMKREKGSTED
tara:strand:+ start:3779 stop:3982 length:204 start_codon:yes stop_codon:yes gene_type:complete